MLFKSTTPSGPVLFQVEVPEGTPIQLTDRNTSYYEVIGRRRHEVYYFERAAPGRGAIRALDLRTRDHRLITDQLPFDALYGVNLTINADETLLATAYAEGIGEHFNRYTRAQRWDAFARLGLTNHLLVINIDTGKIHDIYQINAWLGHVQFAPYDPQMIEFCREISAAADPIKDRMWVIRADGSGLKRIFPQVSGRDVVTHEFWDPKLPMIWFDLHTPALPDRRMYIASVDIESGTIQRYQIPDESWSMHYNIRADGSMFCGDGGYRYSDKRLLQSIWLFHRKGKELVPERIFDMRKHDYARTEPNVHFDPSGQWVIFTYNGEGGRNQVYAVEVKTSTKASPPPVCR